jgi:transposase-like protein
MLSREWRRRSAPCSCNLIQRHPAAARHTWRTVADSLRVRFARVAQLMYEAEDEVLSCLSFPHEHWHQIWSNNPLENDVITTHHCCLSRSARFAFRPYRRRGEA